MKILSKILITALLILPVFVSAALSLEHDYPALPGTAETITVDTSLGGVIRYLVSWAIILGAIIAFGALVYAGIRYLSSTGLPEAMKDAKNRIFSAFLGLTILLGAYLIFMTINPQLMLMRVQKEPIELGVLLLTQAAINDLQRGADSIGIEKLIQKGEVKYLNYELSDCEKQFGDLEQTEPLPPATPITEKNFKNFKMKAVGFFKSSTEEMKVVGFYQKNFEGESREYTKDGRFAPGVTTAENNSFSAGPLTVVYIRFFGEKNALDPKSAANPYRPPLSFYKTRTGPGVYLYAQNGLLKYLQPPKPKDSPLKNEDFDDKARKIEIKNKGDSGQNSDYIVILGEDKIIADDQFRIFFKAKERCPASAPHPCPPDGNTIQGERLNISVNAGPAGIQAEVDQYGKVADPSSIYIGEISQDETACEQVWICTLPEYKGNKDGDGKCLIFHPEKTTIKIEDLPIDEYLLVATEFLPIWQPENIEKEYDFKKIDNTAKRDKFPNDNVYSIKIKGNCLVALFDHTVKAAPDFWDKGGPGGKSEVFIGEQDSFITLAGHNILSCHPFHPNPYLMSVNHSCASAIAIYPIK